MKFRMDGNVCPICGLPRVRFKGHVTGEPLHPECSRKMQQIHKDSGKKSKGYTAPLTEKKLNYFARTN